MEEVRVEIKRRHQAASTTCVPAALAAQVRSGSVRKLPFHFIVDPVSFSLKLTSTPLWPS